MNVNNIVQYVSPDGTLTDEGLRALGQLVGSADVTRIVALTQAEYDALPTKEPMTIYLITDAV